MRPSGVFGPKTIIRQAEDEKWEEINPNYLRDVLSRNVAGHPKAVAEKLRNDVNAGIFSNGQNNEIHQLDVFEFLKQVDGDVLYLDPPYNTRQYVGYYHIPEIIAEGWFEEPPRLRGKTGLPEDEGKRSDWSRRRHCEAAFEQLVNAADCRHILMSYNSEGIISEECIERVLRARGLSDTYRRLEQTYKRYRSDRDSETRRYKGDRVTELLYYIRLA